MPARIRLGELADEIGIMNPTLLATATPDPEHAVLELIEDWGPDMIVVNHRARHGLARRPFIDFDTPHGRIRCQLRIVN